MINHPVLTQLERSLRLCKRPSRAVAIAQRWTHEPALDGLDIAAIQTICKTGKNDQNPIVAALLRLHQNGDQDASTVLMNLMIPMVISVAHDGMDRSLHRKLDTLFGALAHALATIDPDSEPVDSENTIRPFIGYIGIRLSTSRDILDRSTRNRKRRAASGTVEIPVSNFDYVRPESFATPPDSVENATIANDELERIAHIVCSGQFPKASWIHLLNNRISPPLDRPLPDAQRAASYRAATKLSVLVGHAA